MALVGESIIQIETLFQFFCAAPNLLGSQHEAMEKKRARKGLRCEFSRFAFVPP